MRGGRVRAGDFVRSGPSGAPPPYARAFEVGNVSPVGVLVRYPSALYYDRVTAKGWLCTGATSADWVDVGAIAALGAADFVDSGTDDPSVVGVAAPVGSRYRWANGAKAWLKYGANDYSWRSLNETRASVTAAGGPFSELDLTVAVPTDKAVVFTAETRGANVWAYLRVNGAQVAPLAYTDSMYGVWGSRGAIAVAVLGSAANDYGGIGQVKIGPCGTNNRRLVHVWHGHYETAAVCLVGVGMISVGVVTSLGIGAAGTSVNDGTVLRATVADFHGGAP